MAGWLTAVAGLVFFTAWTVLRLTAGLAEPALTGLGEGCCATALRWLAVLGSLAGGVAPAGLGGSAGLRLMGDLQAGRFPLLLVVLALLLAKPGLITDEEAVLVLLLLANKEGELEVVAAAGVLPQALDGTVEETAARLLLTALCLLKGPLAGELRSNPGGVPGEPSDTLLRLLLLVEATQAEPLPRSAARAAFLAAVSGRELSTAVRGPILTIGRGEGWASDRRRPAGEPALNSAYSRKEARVSRLPWVADVHIATQRSSQLRLKLTQWLIRLKPQTPLSVEACLVGSAICAGLIDSMTDQYMFSMMALTMQTLCG